MLWYKALHLIFMVTWFAGLFYLPRLFVYHAMSNDKISIDRFKIMEKKLFYGIATPGGLLTIIFGFCLLISNGVDSYSGQSWFSIKMILIFILVIYHIYCFFLLNDFKYNKNRHTHIWYRWFNEVPVLILVGVVFLAVIKPF
ncbi:MAG: TIGR00701 family protein [Legionellales bacterium]|nr:TIGR00701 family protein [Legionellales bacterium]